jgi:hypothetical protein
MNFQGRLLDSSGDALDLEVVQAWKGSCTALTTVAVQE